MRQLGAQKTGPSAQVRAGLHAGGDLPANSSTSALLRTASKHVFYSNLERNFFLGVLRVVRRGKLSSARH